MKYLIILFLFLLPTTFFAQDQRLTESELHEKTDADLAIIRNEVYARNGYIFNSEEYRSYFGQFGWYKPLNDNSKVILSNEEITYVNLIKEIEAIRSKRPEIIKAYFTNFKNQVLKSGSSYLKSLGIDWKEKVSMQDIVKNINLQEAHFYGDSGGYRMIIDNGKDLLSYYIWYRNNSIILGYGSSDTSELSEDSLWHTLWKESVATGGFAMWLNFSIDDNNNIKYEEINGAG